MKNCLFWSYLKAEHRTTYLGSCFLWTLSMRSKKLVFLPAVHKTVVQTMLKICRKDNLKTKAKYSITQTVVLRHLPQTCQSFIISE